MVRLLKRFFSVTALAGIAAAWQVTPIPANAAATEKPVPVQTDWLVRILSPVNSSRVKGTVLVAAQPNPVKGISSVQLLLDGEPLAGPLSEPYRFDWDTNTARNGPHLIIAVVKDSSGRQTSTAVSVYVFNQHPDFTLTIAPIAIKVRQGANARVRVSVLPNPAFQSPVKLAVTDIPNALGSPVELATLPAPGSGSARFELQANDSAPPGKYTVTVSASGENVQRSVKLEVEIVPAPVVGAETLGINFRATAGFVTDLHGEAAALPNSRYPTTRGGLTFGWTAGAPDSRDRDATTDPRLAGFAFVSNEKAPATFTLDLPAPGAYEIAIAMGDPENDQCSLGCKLEIRDGDKTLFVLTPKGTKKGFVDAQGHDWTPEQWPAKNQPRRVTFTGKQLVMVLGAANGKSEYTPVTHLAVTPVKP